MTIGQKVSFKIMLAGFFVLAMVAAFQWGDWSSYFVAQMLLLSAFIIGFALASGEQITGPLKKFLQKAEHMGAGNFVGRFYHQSKDELGHLSHVFDKISQNLGHNKFELRKLQEAFDERVKHITGLMGETIRALEQKVRNRTAELQKVAKEFMMLREQLAVRDQEVDALKKKLEKGKKAKTKKTKKRARTSRS